MKITAIEPMTCDSGIGGRDWLFVKVTTDEGIVGWGEGYDWQASGPSSRRRIRVLGQEVIGQDPRRIDLIGAAPLGRGQGRRPGADEGPRRDRDRALRHQGQVAGRAGLRAARRAVPRPAAAVLVAFRVVPRDRPGGARGRAGAHDGQLARPRRRRRGGRVQGAQDEPARAGPRDRACRRRSTARSTAPGSMPPSRSSARCATGSARTMGILFDVGQEYRHGGIVELGRALEPFDLYWLEAEGLRRRRAPDRAARDADAAVPRRGAHPARGSSGRSSSATSRTW